MTRTEFIRRLNEVACKPSITPCESLLIDAVCALSDAVEALAPGPRQAGVPATSTDDALAGYLDELERLCDAATSGPWESRSGSVWSASDRNPVCDVDLGSSLDDQPDAMFIAAARHALPKLIAKVRELQAELDDTDKRLRWETTRDDAERQQLERELFGSSTP